MDLDLLANKKVRLYMSGGQLIVVQLPSQARVIGTWIGMNEDNEPVYINEDQVALAMEEK